MQQCWQLNPDHRPPSSDLVKRLCGSEQSEECLLDSPDYEQVCKVQFVKFIFKVALPQGAS